MIKDRCFYFTKTHNECDLATFSLNEESVDKKHQNFVAECHVGRPDILSHHLLGDWELWWAVLRMNNIEDPFNDLERGMLMVTPNNEFIPDYFNSKRR